MRLLADQVESCDVLVVGGGVAGCIAAITAKSLGAERVILVDKGKVSRSGQSSFMAGNWALRLPEESIDDWIEESVVTGDYWNDQEWVRLLWERVHEVTVTVDEWCAESGRKAFQKEENGEFARRKGRGNMKTAYTLANAIPLMEGLRRKAERLGVEVIDRVMVTDLVSNADGCVGAIGLNYRTGKIVLFTFKSAILAASGCGFKSIFIGHRNLTGDMQAAAFRAGVVLRNMENIAHNTCAKHFDIHGMNLMVTVGGKWINAKGEVFMPDYDPVLLNKANQPTKCIALAREIHEGRGPVYFDVTAASPEDEAMCRRILHESFKTWDRAGVNPFREPVEWTTAFYGTIINGGGIHINTACQTNVPGIYAAGDITCIPPHGGYSFGGVHITFSAVSGRVAGEKVMEYLPEASGRPVSGKDLAEQANAAIDALVRPLHSGGARLPDDVILDVQKALIPYRVSLIKNRGTLEDALEKLESVKDSLSDLRARDLHELVKAREAQNMVTLAELMLQAALLRKESRGFHFREDYPIVDNRDWLKWIKVQKDGAGARFWAEDIPMPYVRPTQEYLRPRGLKKRTECGPELMDA